MTDRRTTSLACSLAALLICYAPVLAGMAKQWNSDEDSGHGWFVLPIACFLAWRRRPPGGWRTLQASKPSRWGYALLACGCLLHLLSALGLGLFAGAAAWWLSLLALVLCFGGWAWLRRLAFPLLLLLFALPKLALIYNASTLPLQLLASKLAAQLLLLANQPVQLDGNILTVHQQRLQVVDACNGTRYLLPLSFAALVFSDLIDRRWWVRLVFLAFAVPLAILANAVRVAATALESRLLDTTTHAVLGWSLFLACLLALWGLHRGLLTLTRSRVSHV